MLNFFLMGERDRSRGFWLSEVLLALWLIAFVGAAIIGLFVYLSKSSKVANERAAAELLGDRLMERAVRIGPPNWGLLPGEVGQFLKSPDAPEGTTLDYQLLPVKLGEHRLGTLYVLKLEVAWTGPAEVTNVERGRGRLVRHRQVYIEDLGVAP
jgi:hypothetical protein